MDVALKEWAVVVEALAAGRQLFLLRKGGIAEAKRGFELKHERFLFFPTWEHQQAELIQPSYRELFHQLKPPNNSLLEIKYFAAVSEIRKAPPIEVFLQFGQHIWTEKYIRTRYEYRPDHPLWLVLVRAYRLPQPAQIPYDHRYAGCRSWVELANDVSVEGAQPTLSDQDFESRRQALLESLSRLEGLRTS